MTKKLFVTLATTTLLLNALTPMTFATDTTSTSGASTEISGNGAGSNNNSNSNSNNSTTVVQNNTAHISNNVSSQLSTGGNTADDNTGGNVSVDTGSALSTTDILNKANSNQADVTSLGKDGASNGSTLISGNGAKSQNDVNNSSNTATSLYQKNQADVQNDVQNKLNTGYNRANDNTGGDVSVTTGNAGAATDIQTAVNANVARLSSELGGNGTDTLVKGNGAYSNNSVDLSHNNSVALVQGNNADIQNSVLNNLTTGKNTADYNTGGNVDVNTGNAVAQTAIDNLANFNSADLTRLFGGAGDFTKIAGNGAYSNNHVNANNTDTSSVFQGGDNGNLADFYNTVTNKGKTGENSASKNTGVVENDPVNVTTGHSVADTGVENTGNANVFGPNALQLPDGTNVNFTFDLGSILSGMQN